MTGLRRIIAALLCLAVLDASAQSIGKRLKDLVNPSDNNTGSAGILDPDQAFRLSATPLGPDAVRFNWIIEEGYYLYRDRFSFASLEDGFEYRQIGNTVTARQGKTG